MSELKTQLNDASVKAFIDSVEDEQKKQDCFALVKIFSQITGEVPKMWGSSIIGFGKYHYKSERSSQEGDWMLTGFSPRKQNLTLYIMDGFENYADLLAILGKYKTSKSCLYINWLSDIDQNILADIVKKSYAAMKSQNRVTYPMCDIF